MKSSQTKGSPQERENVLATLPSHVRHRAGVQNNSAQLHTELHANFARAGEFACDALCKERGRPSERGDTGTSVAANQLVLAFVSAMRCVRMPMHALRAPARTMCVGMWSTPHGGNEKL